MPAAHNIPALPARQTGVFLFYHISQSVEISNFPVLFPTIMGNCWIGDFITGGLTAKVDILGLTEDALYELIYGKWQPIVNRVLTGRCSYQIWKCAPAARYLIYGVGQQEIRESPQIPIEASNPAIQQIGVCRQHNTPAAPCKERI